MAFDGFMIAALKHELDSALTGGRINKISQPESDELLLTVKKERDSLRLSICADPSYPLIHLTENNKPGPGQAPAFCMLLRKHLQNGRILSVTQPGLERVIDICVEHMDEMGDLTCRHLIAEFMGKHSNIILTNEKDVILDSIKRIPSSISSVREVLPGRPYFIPDAESKINPYDLDEGEFYKRIFSYNGVLYKALYSNITGFSPAISVEICNRTGIDADRPALSLSLDERKKLYSTVCSLMDEISENDFKYGIYYDSDKIEFSPVSLIHRTPAAEFDSPSEMLTHFYSKKSLQNRMRQKSADLRKLTSNFLERAYKKLSIQENDIEKTKNREKYRIYGELLQAYGYNITPGASSVELENYYDNNAIITVPLKTELTPQENANAYFKRYNKLKRTYEAATLQADETRREIELLESVSNSLEIAENEDDLAQIRLEMEQTGFLHASKNKNKTVSKTKPLHFISSDGFDIYVGKNNIQNDELTFKMADSGDWWFHAKGIAGSHVILKTEGKDVPDKTFEEAAALAAFYSKAKDQKKTEVDYVLKKEIKKPAGSPPGFVVYYTNYSMIADITDKERLTQSD